MQLIRKKCNLFLQSSLTALLLILQSGLNRATALSYEQPPLSTKGTEAGSLLHKADTATLTQVIVLFKSKPMDLEKANAMIPLLSKTSGLPFQSVKPLAFDLWLYTLDTTALEKQYDLHSPEYKRQFAQGLRRLNTLPAIEFAEADELGKLAAPKGATAPSASTTFSPNQQWDMLGGPGGIFARCPTGGRPCTYPAAWSLTQGSNQVVVAVIDSGTGTNDNLNANLLPGWNFVSDNRDTRDETGSWHGEHVSGIIAALGTTVYGVGPRLKVLPEKVFQKNSRADETDIINAIAWAIDAPVPTIPANPNKASVINLSLTLEDFCSRTFKRALEAAGAEGVAVVVAAGNEDKPSGTFSLANCPHVITVAATTIKGLRARYSNYGRAVTLAAPGGQQSEPNDPLGILSTGDHNTFLLLHGSSMAAPHVSGVAALLYSLHDFKNDAPTNYRVTQADLVEAVLVNTVHPFAPSNNPDVNCQGKKTCGSGIVDAYRATNAVAQHKSIGVSALDAHSEAHLALNSTANTKTVCTRGRLQASALQWTEKLSNGVSLVWKQISTACAPSQNYQTVKLSVVPAEKKQARLQLVFGPAPAPSDQGAPKTAALPPTIYQAAFPEGYRCALIDTATRIGCLQK